MYSLDFEEYLWAIGYRPEVIDETLRRPFASLKPVPEITNRRFLQLFRDYIVIGGMPEVVATYLESNNYNVAFDVQRRILSANLDDIARYELEAALLFVDAQGDLRRLNVGALEYERRFAKPVD